MIFEPNVTFEQYKSDLTPYMPEDWDGLTIDDDDDGGVADYLDTIFESTETDDNEWLHEKYEAYTELLGILADVGFDVEED